MYKYRNIYLSIYLSIFLSVYFCISKKIEQSVRLLHCYMSGGMSALVVCFACLSASFFLLLSVSCSRTWWALLFLVCAFFKTLSLPWLVCCYLCAISCYLCAISVLSMLSQVGDSALICATSVLPLCYLCAISVLSMLSHARESFLLCAISVLSMLSHARESFLLCAISVLSLCYLCYLMLSLCYLCAISLISLEYFSQICGLYTD